MSKLVAWSFSRIESYEQCPRKFWEESVAKNIPFEKNEAAQYGDDVHKAFKEFFANGKRLPLHLLHYQAKLETIAAAPGDKVVEQQLALDAEWQVVSWFDKTAYLRVISDLTQVHGPNAVIWDWKTGKMKEGMLQLKLNAAVTFHLDPQIQNITVAYYWLKNNKVVPLKIARSEAPDIWGEILPRVAKYQEAHDTNTFPPRPNFLCKGFCKVKNCQYWEPKR